MSKTSSARDKVSKRQTIFENVYPSEKFFFYNMQRKMYDINPKQGLESGYSTIDYVDILFTECTFLVYHVMVAKTSNTKGCFKWYKTWNTIINFPSFVEVPANTTINKSMAGIHCKLIVQRSLLFFILYEILAVVNKYLAATPFKVNWRINYAKLIEQRAGVWYTVHEAD